MTQTELNALTDKSNKAFVLGILGDKVYVEPENGRYFERYEIRLIVGDDIKITEYHKNNMLILEDSTGSLNESLIIRKDQIR